jgi:uncharacterized protein HemX
MRVFGILLAIAIVIGLGAAIYSQRDRFGSASTSADTQLQDVEHNNAAAIADLQKQVQDLKAQSQAPGQQDIADLKSQIAAEQGERKMLSDQLGALSARVDSLVKANAAEITPPPAPVARRHRR